MVKLPMLQVDACTSSLYAGNPAAVCPLEYWLEDMVMQFVAKENGEIWISAIQKEITHGA